MVPVRTASAVCVPLPLLFACAAPPRSAIAPLEGARPQELRLVVEPVSGHVRPLEAGFELASEERPAVHVRVRWLVVPEEALAQAVGEPARSLFGLACPREQARALVEALLTDGVGGVEVDDMTLGIQEDQDGYLSVIHQRAYVAGFELVAGPAAVLADPRIDVAQEGVLLQVRASREPGGRGWALALELTSTELDLPLPERELRLGSVLTPVTLQVPSGVVRRLTCGASPEADEALLLGGAALNSAPRAGGTSLVLVELDPIGPEGEVLARQ